MHIFYSLVYIYSLFTIYVKCCIDQGEDIFLNEAIEENNLDVLTWLLNHNAKVDIADENGRTPLMHAIKQKEGTKIIDTLFQERADPNLSDVDGKTALFLAAELGRLDIINVLLENGAKADLKDTIGRTFIHAAASSGQTSVIDEISNSSLFPDMINSQDYLGRSPSWYAAAGGHEDTTILLENLGANNESDTLIGAVYGGNVNIVKHLIEAGSNVSIKNESGMSLLQIASDKGHADVIKYLLSLGADIGVKSVDKKNLLHIASEAGNPEVVETLILSGLKENVNDEDILGNTPAHYAAINDHINCLQSLKLYGGRFDLRNKQGNSPIDEATIKGNSNTLSYFLDEGIPIDHTDLDGKTLLHKASEASAVSSILILSEAGANFTLKDNAGNLPIHYAIRDIDTLKALLNSSLDIDLPGEGGKTALQMAADSVNIRAVKCLLKYGAHPERVQITAGIEDRYFAYATSFYPTKNDVKNLLRRVLYGELKANDLEC